MSDDGAVTASIDEDISIASPVADVLARCFAEAAAEATSSGRAKSRGEIGTAPTESVVNGKNRAMP